MGSNVRLGLEGLNSGLNSHSALGFVGLLSLRQSDLCRDAHVCCSELLLGRKVG